MPRASETNWLYGIAGAGGIVAGLLICDPMIYLSSILLLTTLAPIVSDALAVPRNRRLRPRRIRLAGAVLVAGLMGYAAAVGMAAAYIARYTLEVIR